jgi:2-phospho-L-lactate/phosphoenolpyruvate guanylyltransferase
LHAAHLLIPLKRLDDAKSRLAGVLTAEERSALMLELLEGVLAAAEEADLGPITIVSAEPSVPDLAARFDDRGLAWNDALAAAMREVVAEPVAAVVSADLPRVTAEDIQALVAATPDRGLAVARALDGGTNAVSMRPPGAVMTHFGEHQSAAVHAQATAAAGLAARIVDIPGLAFDVDTPADLEELRASHAGL